MWSTHCLPGRLRLRIPGKRGNETYGADLRKPFTSRPGVVAVSGNPCSGAVRLG
ncbi:MAG: hypothetical protein MUF20_03290 [Methylotetracoccus sp.]|nr:hypothetical protein [Methylotetracoccus sp.]